MPPVFYEYCPSTKLDNMAFMPRIYETSCNCPVLPLNIIRYQLPFLEHDFSGVDKNSKSLIQIASPGFQRELRCDIVQPSHELVTITHHFVLFTFKLRLYGLQKIVIK